MPKEKPTMDSGRQERNRAPDSARCKVINTNQTVNKIATFPSSTFVWLSEYRLTTYQARLCAKLHTAIVAMVWAGASKETCALWWMQIKWTSWLQMWLKDNASTTQTGTCQLQVHIGFRWDYAICLRTRTSSKQAFFNLELALRLGYPTPDVNNF